MSTVNIVHFRNDNSNYIAVQNLLLLKGRKQVKASDSVIA